MSNRQERTLINRKKQACDTFNAIRTLIVKPNVLNINAKNKKPHLWFAFRTLLRDNGR